MEVNAIRASYDAYINSIKIGHKEMVESLHSEHVEQVSGMKNQFAIDITKVQAELAHERHTTMSKQQAAIAEASQKAKAQSAERVAELERKLREKQSELDQLQDKYKDSLVSRSTLVNSAEQQIARLKDQQNNLKTIHRNQLKEMEAKLAVGPNSWIQMRFLGKGRIKPRTYWHRYSVTMKEATKELMKEMSGVAEDYIFRPGGPAGLVCNVKHTLQQVSLDSRR